MSGMKIPAHGLSVRHIESEARNIDWGEFSHGDLVDGYQVILPDPTYGGWQENAYDVPPHIARRKSSTVMSDEHKEEFEQTDAYYQWRDSFEPMMNYGWPVDLAYGVDVATAVANIEKFGGACSLIELSEEAAERLYGYDGAPEYLIALTGGGMNLSDHLAAAYLACGCVPPRRILESLNGVISPEKARRIPLRAAYREMANFYTLQARNAREEARRIFAAK